jgi:ADP-ribose pyrophosphatase
MEILKKTVVAQSPYLNFIETKYVNMLGDESTWNWVQRPNSRRAVVIAALMNDAPIYNSDGLMPSIEGYTKKMVVIKEYRVPVEGYEVGFPAGLIDEGETPADAVRRELGEETGLKLETIEHISPPVISSAGLSDEAVYIAYVTVSGRPNRDNLEASEDIDTFLLSQDEVAALMLDAETTIGKTAYPVMRSFVKFGEI